MIVFYVFYYNLLSQSLPLKIENYEETPSVLYSVTLLEGIGYRNSLGERMHGIDSCYFNPLCITPQYPDVGESGEMGKLVLLQL